MGGAMRGRVLLICNYFAPDHTIAAVRTSKLTKYLRQNGYEVEVFAEKKQGGEDELLKKDVEGVRIHYAENSKGYLRFRGVYEKLTASYRKKRFDNLEDRKRVNPRTGHVEFYTFETAYPVIGSLDYIAGQLKQIDLFWSVRRKLREAAGFDYAITSYGDSFSYFAGRYFHRYHRDVTWIFDIRDAVYRYKFTPGYVSFIPKRYERYIWRHADCITGVSKGICKTVPRKFRNKVHLLTNGYELADRKGLQEDRMDAREMAFTYTGSMYGGLQDLSVFFEAMAKLIRGGEINPEKIRFHFAGNASAFQIFKSQAEKYGLGGRCMDHGKLSRQDALELQQRSDILLSAAYDYKDHEGGIITGKIFEYMAAERPVISIITGDIEHSELADIVQKTNIGIAYEDADRKDDYPELCEYIRRQYRAFTGAGQVEYAPDKKEFRRYDYRYLGKRLIKIMEQEGKRL